MRYDRGYRDRSRQELGTRYGGRGGGRSGEFEGRGGGYGRDYWWLGEHELERQGYRPSYDEAYRRFDERTHPRYSPVGGMYGPMGGSYVRRAPGPLRDPRRFSEWTRWF
jgi:hypothetical protein